MALDCAFATFRLRAATLTLSGPAWTEAKRRAEIIAPLARPPRVGHDAADLAAAQLGLSRRRIYQLIGRARQGEGLVTDLTVGRSGGGRGEGLLPDKVERIISDVLFELYLQRQRRSATAVEKAIAIRCRRAALCAPSRGAIRRRIDRLDPEVAARRRLGEQASRHLKPAAGAMPAPERPLAVVQDADSGLRRLAAAPYELLSRRDQVRMLEFVVEGGVGVQSGPK